MEYVDTEKLNNGAETIPVEMLDTTESLPKACIVRWTLFKFKIRKRLIFRNINTSSPAVNYVVLCSLN